MLTNLCIQCFLEELRMLEFLQNFCKIFFIRKVNWKRCENQFYLIGNGDDTMPPLRKVLNLPEAEQNQPCTLPYPKISTVIALLFCVNIHQIKIINFDCQVVTCNFKIFNLMFFSICEYVLNQTNLLNSPSTYSSLQRTSSTEIVTLP